MSTPNLKLWEATDALQIVLDWIEENPAELVASGGVLPEHLQELLESAEATFDAKVERVALYIRNLQVSLDATQAEIERLGKIEKTTSNQIDTLKEYLKRELRIAGRKVETPRCKVRVQVNGRCSISSADPTDIPAKFRIQPPPPPPRLDSEAAHAWLKDEGKIPTEPTDEPIIYGGLKIERGCHVRIQ